MKKIILFFIAFMAISSASFAQDLSEDQLQLKKEIIEAVQIYGDYQMTEESDNGLILIKDFTDRQYGFFVTPVGKYSLLVTLFSQESMYRNLNKRAYEVALNDINFMATGVKASISNSAVVFSIDSYTYNAKNYQMTFIDQINKIRDAAEDIHLEASKVKLN